MYSSAFRSPPVLYEVARHGVLFPSAIFSVSSVCPDRGTFEILVPAFCETFCDSKAHFLLHMEEGSVINDQAV